MSDRYSSPDKRKSDAPEVVLQGMAGLSALARLLGRVAAQEWLSGKANNTGVIGPVSAAPDLGRDGGRG